MKAVVITTAGPPGVLALLDRPDPVPGRGEVLIRVAAAGLNRADLLQRRGQYPAPPGAVPDIPGVEFAGTVEALGSGVDQPSPGSRVMGLVPGGAQAERLCVDAGLCLAVPEGMAWTDAAAIPEAFLAAHDALFRIGRLVGGQSVLITAAASGVGTAACQLAAFEGARAIGSTRDPAKRSRLTTLGVASTVDPNDVELGAQIAAATDGAGLDLVLDLVGGAALPRHLPLLRERGRLVLLGLLGGVKAEIDLGLVLRRQLTLIGSVLRPRSLVERRCVVRAFARHALAGFTDGRLCPVVHRVYAFDDVARAHGDMERSEHFGKLVLTWETA